MKRISLPFLVAAAVALTACSSKPVEPTEAEMRSAMEKVASQDLLGPKKVTTFKKHQCDKGMSMTGDDRNMNYPCSFEIGLNGGPARQSMKIFSKDKDGWN